MQYIKYIFVIALFTVVACNSTPERPSAILDPNYVPPAEPAPAMDTKAPEPAQNSLGVWHYTCPNGHAGGGGSATACSECGTTLVHNTAYHDAAAAPTTPTTSSTIIPAGSEGINVTPGALPNAKAPEPAQNADGVWHYTCSNGCSGGAGSAVACSSCGSTLAHNSGYH